MLREGILLVGAMLIAGSCNAMSSPSNSQGRCQIVDGSKLPASSGGSDALCAAIARAVAAGSPGVDYVAKVRVISPSRLAANVTYRDEALPEVQFAIMDREIGPNSFDRFAAAIAAEIAKARQ